MQSKHIFKGTTFKLYRDEDNLIFSPVMQSGLNVFRGAFDKKTDINNYLHVPKIELIEVSD